MNIISKKIVLDLHRICTQRCPYCVAGIQKTSTHGFGKISDELNKKHLISFIENNGPFNCILTGGEPLITPNIEDILFSISQTGSHISIQTNISKNIQAIVKSTPPSSVEWILASLHSVALPNINNFLRNASELQKNGYPVVVKIICDTPMMKIIDNIAKVILHAKIPFILSPLIEFPDGKPCYSRRYSLTEWKKIQKYISTKSSWLYFSSGFDSYKTPCRAGKELFYANIENGNINGCSHGFPKNIGNIYTGEFFPEKTNTICTIKNCICDFHYYTNTIPHIELQQEFASLLHGEQRIVTFEEYDSFIKKHKIKQIYDIQSLLLPHVNSNNKENSDYSTTKSLQVLQKQSYDTLIQRGEQLFKEGKNDEAKAIFSELARDMPARHEAWNNLGVLSYAQKNCAKAEAYLRTALTISPGNVDIIYNLMQVLITLNRNQEAIDAGMTSKNTTKIHNLLTQLSANIHKSKDYTSQQEFKFCTLSAEHLHKPFGFDEHPIIPHTNRTTPLGQWKMELNDAPIFRYLYRNFRPRRHLEFGTWQGAGVVYCLEECDATVWTVNLPFGEMQSDGSTIYSGKGESFGLDTSLADAWARRLGLPPQDAYRTDSFGFIGRFYLEKQLGNRVCQIYCDSTKWDISNYPEGFFDSVLIDGGHVPDVVLNDTKKALALLRPGGLIMWHDFCPPVHDKFDVVQGVMKGLKQAAPLLEDSLENLFWIEPSWILCGVKK